MIVLNEEQEMLRDMAQNWVADRAPVTALRTVRDAFADKGFDPALYNEMVEMGWASILVPESHGGVDMGLVTIGLIAEELGRTLTASPLLSSAVGAVSAIALGDNDDAKGELLPAIATGASIAALALDEGAHHQPHAVRTTATADGNGWIIDGEKRAVAEASAADLLIVSAIIAGTNEIGLFAVPSDTSGISVTALKRIDSRNAGDIQFRQVRVEGSARQGSGAAYLDAVLDRVRVALAAEMLGGTAQAFDTTIEYLKTRVQFDHPIGSFQALQHRAAEILGEIQLTRSSVYGALAAIDEGREDAPALASLAKSMAGDTFRAMAREMVQMHGGIGMTDEHDAGLYLKRAHATDHAFGNAAFHRERFARFLNI